MSKPASAPLAGSSAFLDRIVRVVAIVMLCYASLHLVQYVLYLVVEGSWWGYARGNLRPAERAVQLSRFSLLLMLLAGSVGLLKGKPWARAVVMLWAPLVIVMTVGSAVVYFVQHMRDLSTAATQAVFSVPLWRHIMWQVFWVVDDTFLPLIVWLVLRQPEVARRFERTTGGGGFEVVPLARTAGTADASGSPRG